MEKVRLQEARKNSIRRKKWGPYLSERQWGTVRENYIENGDAWNFFTHDHTQSWHQIWLSEGDNLGKTNKKNNPNFLQP